MTAKIWAEGSLFPRAKPVQFEKSPCNGCWKTPTAASTIRKETEKKMRRAIIFLVRQQMYKLTLFILKDGKCQARKGLSHGPVKVP